MTEQTVFSLGEAAKLTGKSKGTISAAIKAGRLSAQSREGGRYQIAAAELFRVYPPPASGNGSNGGAANGGAEHHRPPENTGQDSNLAHQIALKDERLTLLESERHRERSQLEDTIRDLRGRLDREEEERRAVTRQLTDQRERDSEAATALRQISEIAGEIRAERTRPWWERVFGIPQRSA